MRKLKGIPKREATKLRHNLKQACKKNYITTKE